MIGKRPRPIDAAATAVAITRLLRGSGFLMAKRTNRHHWTEGFYACRISSTRRVEVHYHVTGKTRICAAFTEWTRGLKPQEHVLMG